MYKVLFTNYHSQQLLLGSKIVSEIFQDSNITIAFFGNDLYIYNSNIDCWKFSGLSDIEFTNNSKFNNILLERIKFKLTKQSVPTKNNLCFMFNKEWQSYLLTGNYLEDNSSIAIETFFQNILCFKYQKFELLDHTQDFGANFEFVKVTNSSERSNSEIVGIMYRYNAVTVLLRGRENNIIYCESLDNDLAKFNYNKEKIKIY